MWNSPLGDWVHDGSFNLAHHHQHFHIWSCRPRLKPGRLSWVPEFFELLDESIFQSFYSPEPWTIFAGKAKFTSVIELLLLTCLSNCQSHDFFRQVEFHIGYTPASIIALPTPIFPLPVYLRSMVILSKRNLVFFCCLCLSGWFLCSCLRYILTTSPRLWFANATGCHNLRLGLKRIFVFAVFKIFASTMQCVLESLWPPHTLWGQSLRARPLSAQPLELLVLGF